MLMISNVSKLHLIEHKQFLINTELLLPATLTPGSDVFRVCSSPIQATHTTLWPFKTCGCLMFLSGDMKALQCLMQTFCHFTPLRLCIISRLSVNSSSQRLQKSTTVIQCNITTFSISIFCSFSLSHIYWCSLSLWFSSGCMIKGCIVTFSTQP